MGRRAWKVDLNCQLWHLAKFVSNVEGSMKRYNVYSHPTEGFAAVKIGFSWPALFFGFFWMLLKRMWGLAGIWFLLYLGLFFFDKVTMEMSQNEVPAAVYLILSLGYFALWLIPAFKGNEWRENNLAKKGYDRLSSVEAATPEAAVAQVAKASA